MIGFLIFLIVIVSVGLIAALYVVVRHGRREGLVACAAFVVALALLVWVRTNLHEIRNGDLLVLENRINHTRTTAFFTDVWYRYPLFIERMDNEANE